jgi:predicted transcriptional regulator
MRKKKPEPIAKAIEELVAQGLVEKLGDKYRLTDKGLDRVDELVGRK